MEKILYLDFNQTSSCFFIGTTRGYQIYTTSPLKKIADRKFEDGICTDDNDLICPFLILENISPIGSE